MKTLSSILVVAALGSASLIPATSFAAPMISVGDSVDIFFRMGLSGRYESNVFNSETNESDDFVFTFSPGVEVRIGRNSNAQASIIFTENIVRYSDLSDQDTETANLTATGSYKSGRLTSKALFRFYESQQNLPTDVAGNNLVADQVERDNYQGQIEAEYNLSQKTFLEGRVDWNSTDYVNNADFGDTFTDRTSVSVPVNIFYRYSPKSSIGLGYRYRLTNVSDVLARGLDGDIDDHFFSVALRGELFPKVDARVNIGGQIREDSRAAGNDTTNFSLDLQSVYRYSPKLSLNGALERDFGVAGAGSSIEKSTVRVGANYRINQLIGTNARFSYRFSDFETGREDDTFRFNLGASYSPNSYLSFSGGYSLLDNSSNSVGSSFTTHVISLSAALRY